MDVLGCIRRVAIRVVPMAFVVFVFGNSLSALTVVVGTCRSLVQFTTIQAAINAVPSGSTVDICPGTYHEQITIKQSVTLTGVASGSSDEVVILPPSGGLIPNATSLSSGSAIAAQVWVEGPLGPTQKVNFNNLVVDSLGNGLSGCGAPTLAGILYQNASGALQHVATRNQWIGSSESDTGSNGCQNGLGIFVQSGNSGTSAVSVLNSSVHDYQKNGITGNEVGTSLTVMNNDIVGQGATVGAAENGIQIGFGASGSISGNLVIDDVWAPDTSTDPGDAAAGILLFDAASGASVKSNTVGNTQFGIAAVTDTSGEGDDATISLNKVFGTRIFDGIDVCVNNSTVQSNTIMNSTESAIHVDASCPSTGTGNTVTGNTIVEACTGVLVDATATGDTISPNTYFEVGMTSGSSCTPTPQSTAAGARPLSQTRHGAIRP